MEPPPIRAARLESKKSKSRFKIGAAIARKNKVLVCAHNIKKTHPKFGSGNYKTLHAESHAIYKAVRRGIDLSGTTIFVYRVNDLLAKPCKWCQKLINDHGIKEVIYSKG
jgi:cytidine deaminase